MNLSEFLLARIAEDEAGAVRSCGAVHPTEDIYCGPDGHPDPKRLAECEAKRRIVELHQSGGNYTPGDDKAEGFDYCATCGSGEPYEYPTPWPCETLQLLALPYADHPDYDENWRP